MMKSVENQQELFETDHDLIEAELKRLLADKPFSGAPQMSAFLKYIVTQTLDGYADRIKAYSVGVDALGKPDTFDAQNDPSVRVLALRLRKTLEAIYDSGTPAHAIVRLKVGTYVPMFLKSPCPVPGAAVLPEHQRTHGTLASIGSAHRHPTTPGLHEHTFDNRTVKEAADRLAPGRDQIARAEMPELPTNSKPTMLRGTSLSPVRPPLTVTPPSSLRSEKNSDGLPVNLIWNLQSG